MERAEDASRALRLPEGRLLEQEWRQAELMKDSQMRLLLEQELEVWERDVQGEERYQESKRRSSQKRATAMKQSRVPVQELFHEQIRPSGIEAEIPISSNAREQEDMERQNIKNKISLLLLLRHRFPNQWHDFEHIFHDLSNIQAWERKKGKALWRVKLHYYWDFTWTWGMFLWAITWGAVSQTFFRQSK